MKKRMRTMGYVFLGLALSAGVYAFTTQNSGLYGIVVIFTAMGVFCLESIFKL